MFQMVEQMGHTIASSMERSLGKVVEMSVNRDSGTVELAQSMKDSIAALASRKETSALEYQDKVNVVGGADFKRAQPKITDKDYDFRTFLRRWRTYVQCCIIGKKPFRDIELLLMFRECFQEGSIRWRVYDLEYRKAEDQGRIPHEAKEVLEEIITKLSGMLFETPIAKCNRIEREFDALQQGNLVHLEFHSLWESKLQDMKEIVDSGVEWYTMPSEGVLYRKYLSKLHPEDPKPYLVQGLED